MVGVRSRIGGAVMVLLALLTGCAGEAGSPQPVSGLPVAELQSRWWTWAASQPFDTNPVVDPTGEDCAVEQAEDVWLLAGSFGEVLTRECQVPAGVPLAGPVLNLFSENRDDCVAFMRDAEGELLLDGVPQDFRRIEPIELTFTGEADNEVTGRAGTVRTIGCGLWFVLDPPSSGEHTVVIRGSSGALSVDVTYALIVEPLA